MFNKDKMILQQIGLVPKDDDKVVHGHWGTAPFVYQSGRMVVQGGALNYPIYKAPEVSVNAIEDIEFQGEVVLPQDSSFLLAGCTQLSSVQGLGHWNTDGVESLAYVFLDDTKVQKVDLADLDTYPVQDMKGMFEHTGFRDIDVSMWDFHNVDDFSDMFKDNARLTRIDMHDANTGKGMDFSRFIYNDNRLTDIDVRGMDTSHAQDMSRMFAHNDSITTIDVQGFRTDSVDTMDSMFIQCGHLREIYHVMDLRTDHYNNMDFIFDNDDDLNTINEIDVTDFYHHSSRSFEEMF